MSGSIPDRSMLICRSGLPGRALGASAHHQPIESTFSTVRHRTKVTKGSRAAGLAMAFKLIESAPDRWRAVNAPHLVALVRAGARVVNGQLVERPDEHAAQRSSAPRLKLVLTNARVRGESAWVGRSCLPRRHEAPRGGCPQGRIARRGPSWGPSS